MRKGYEGLTVAVWMLLTAWVLVAIAKLLF
jgi:hypothetical protein